MDTSTREYRLAVELAETLKDRASLASYLKFTRTYSETHIREVLAKVMSLEEHKIRKTRGALFTYLVKQSYDNTRN